MRLKITFGFLCGSFGRSVNLAFILCLVLLPLLAANGQELLSPQPKDSTTAKAKKQPIGRTGDTSITHAELHVSELSAGRIDLMVPLSLKTFPPNLPSSLEQAMTLSVPVPSAALRANADILSAWKSDLARQDEYKTLKTIASSIEMTGTAYLAYLSLKRYGLK